MRLRGALTVALIALAPPALASAALPINGIFGNETGCAFFMTGDVVTDDFMTLTPDTFTSYGTRCAFDRLLSAVDGVYTVAATCSNEGEDGATRDMVKVIDRRAEGFFLQFEGLEEWGPMTPCPGTEALFDNGVRT